MVSIDQERLFDLLQLRIKQICLLTLAVELLLKNCESVVVIFTFRVDLFYDIFTVCLKYFAILEGLLELGFKVRELVF